MQTDFLAAVKQIAAEKGLDYEEVLDAIKQAIRVGFKKDYPEEVGNALEIEIDPEGGSIAVYADKKVVTEVTNPPTQIDVADAKKIESKLKVGDHVLVEITHTGDFGRVAAQAARQVITQKLRESEKEAIMKQFTDKIGTVESAIVQRRDMEGNVFCEIYRAIAKMPVSEQISTERYKSGDRIKVYLKKIQVDARGKILIISRSDPQFLKALFEMEVPEIASGTVEIMAIAREAGSRSKVAVRSNAEGVDPIGACVGQRGARINAITNELRVGIIEEKIDIIPWSDDLAQFIGNSIRPAEAIQVKIINEDDKQALIIVDDEYLSLAIGRDGQNVRLAAKLTGWKLDIQGTAMNKENEGRSKFEQDALGIVVDRKKKVTKEDKKEVGSEKAEKSNEENDLAGLSTRIIATLAKAGITNKEELKAKVEAGEKIAGIGEKALTEIKAVL